MKANTQKNLNVVKTDKDDQQVNEAIKTATSESSIEKESSNIVSKQEHANMTNKDLQPASLKDLNLLATSLLDLGARFFKYALVLRKREKAGEILQDFEKAVIRRAHTMKEALKFESKQLHKVILSSQVRKKAEEVKGNNLDSYLQYI